MNAHVAERVRNLPLTPGVYLMKDSRGSIIYVGKAKQLKRRVQSYFHNSKSHSPKIAKLVAHIAELEYRNTDTEFEAFMLECRLIQELKPMYNRKMKNPLAYTYVVIRNKAGLRRMEVTDTLGADREGLYFGPYTANKHAVERAIQSIEECYHIACSQPLAGRACLNHSLGLCNGVCLGGSAVQEYERIMDRIVSLLQGTGLALLHEMEQSMLEAAERFEFEEAAKWRDHIEAVNFLLRKRKVIEFSEQNLSIVVYEYVDDTMIKLFLIRRNQILFSEKYPLPADGQRTWLATEIRSRILHYFKPNSASDDAPVQIGREEIDQAQIIYSYLHGSGSHHLHIQSSWLKEKGQQELNEALDSFLLPSSHENI
ncbi:GIY-YIG nuclease family protein [Paenibacillus sp. D2_2]|uniref:GIY-YIG nuclease family protein n=1 Tax=Paenibacillus sp. D2_2 TaxID=3073092 RepID=UPI002814E57C|nr:GIY-YIG nuclease family protein [Paenibacillus sp. D2_2]WMT39041.1 GIY-YIG nuclease family protein [Paenibacillus sp. D2_2]